MFNWGVSVEHFEGLSNEQSEAVGPVKLHVFCM